MLARMVLATLLLISGAAFAHDIPRDTLITAFVKIDAREAHFVVRVPLELVGNAQFPTLGPVIDLGASAPASERALDGITTMVMLWENDARLVAARRSAKLSLPSDPSFADYATAAAHVDAPLEADTEIYAGQGYIDAHYVYPITSPDSVFDVQLQLTSDLTRIIKLTTRYVPLSGESRAMVVTADLGRVALNPTFLQAARSFVALGIEHLLTGIDHLLFVLCLIIPVRQLRPLIIVVTAFTLGHSVTLIASAFDIGPSGAWFPPFVETAIAASILYTAIENAIGASVRWRWALAGLFGMVHGFGFSYALKEYLQFSGSHLLTSLFAFNLGIELGQIAVLLAFLGILAVVLRGPLAGRAGIILLSLFIGHTAWDWMLERGAIFWQIEAAQGNEYTAYTWAAALAGVILIIAAAGAVVRRVERAGDP